MKNKWKVSRYITIVDLDRVLLFYGGISGGLVQVSYSYQAVAKKIIEEPNRPFEEHAQELQSLFVEKGILVPEEVNEIDFLRKRYKQSKQAVSRQFSLTICPTLNCNFRCNYCYQHHPKGKMPEDIQDKILNLLHNRTPVVSKLNITWFGGESLLALPVIERLSQKFSETWRDGSEYSAKLISNGWGLTPKVSKLLADLNVRSVQVTLDGPRAIHDKRRPLLNGKPTFDRITDNISSADKRLKIIIRVNVDRTNASSIPELYDELDAAGLKGKLTIYFAPVIPYTDLCSDISQNCIPNEKWAKYTPSLQLSALKRGYGGGNLPKPKGHACIADGQQGLVITPKGLVYKCWNDVTQEDKAVFNLATFQQSDKMIANQQEWLGWSPFNNYNCRNCNVLPICMGGCPYLSVRNSGLEGHQKCKEIKHNLSEQIAIHFLRYTRKQAANLLLNRMHSHFRQVSGMRDIL